MDEAKNLKKGSVLVAGFAAGGKARDQHMRGQAACGGKSRIVTILPRVYKHNLAY